MTKRMPESAERPAAGVLPHRAGRPHILAGADVGVRRCRRRRAVSAIACARKAAAVRWLISKLGRTGPGTVTAPRAAIVGISGPVLLAEEAALFRASPPAGVILFSRNIQDQAQLSA